MTMFNSISAIEFITSNKKFCMDVIVVAPSPHISILIKPYGASPHKISPVDGACSIIHHDLLTHKPNALPPQTNLHILLI